jgi:flagellum-specific ATP synthase
MPAVCSPEHLAKAAQLRALMASYRSAEDLVRIGAYQKGSDPTLDAALSLLRSLNPFLQQTPAEAASFDATRTQLLALGA